MNKTATRTRDIVPAAQRRAAGTMVDVLIEAGVSKVFGVPGGAISPLNDALLDSGIEHLTCQHETMAVHMAAGYARATGKPGVVMVTSGPGTLNALTGIAAAYQDEAPVVLLAGEVATSTRGRGALQDGGPRGLDILGAFGPVTKMAALLSQPERAATLLQQALEVAGCWPRGPVLLSLPVDLTRQHVPSPAPVVEMAATACRPTESQVAAAARALAGARRPLLWLGVGAREAGVSDTLIELAECWRLPVATDLEAKGVFPESHPLSLGIIGIGAHGSGTRYLRDGVDALVTVGSRLDDSLTDSYSPLFRPSDGLLVQIDHAPLRMGRAYRADVELCGPLADVLERLRDAMPAPDPRAVLERDAVLTSKYASVPRPRHSLSHAPHDPRAVLAALQSFMPDDTVYTTDIGNHHIFATQSMRVDHPDAFYVPHGLGGMTTGIGVAMGLALGFGGRRRVVAICGDGGLLMGGSDLATCAHFQIPVTLAVFDNGQLGMVQHGLEQIFGRSLDLSTPKVDIGGYARALGVRTFRVEREADLAAAVEATGPIVLDIPIDPDVRASNPREAVVSFLADKRKAS